MRFGPIPSQDRVDAFQKKLKLVFAVFAFVAAFPFLTQAGLELAARRGFSSVSGTVDSIQSYSDTSPDQSVPWLRALVHQNIGVPVTYHYTVDQQTYTGQDTVSSNRSPSKRAVSTYAVTKGQTRTILVSKNNPSISRIPRPVAYPSAVGVALSLVGLFLVWMRNDKTPHYYDSRAYTQN